MQSSPPAGDDNNKFEISCCFFLLFVVVVKLVLFAVGRPSGQEMTRCTFVKTNICKYL